MCGGRECPLWAQRLLAITWRLERTIGVAAFKATAFNPVPGGCAVRLCAGILPNSTVTTHLSSFTMTWRASIVSVLVTMLLRGPLFRCPSGIRQGEKSLSKESDQLRSPIADDFSTAPGSPEMTAWILAWRAGCTRATAAGKFWLCRESSVKRIRGADTAWTCAARLDAELQNAKKRSAASAAADEGNTAE